MSDISKEQREIVYEFLSSRINSYVKQAEIMRSHQQYIEGLKDALDIITDELRYD